MAKGLDVVINGVETVSEKMDDIESSVRSANQALGGLSRELKDASVSSEVLESSSDGVARSATKVNATVRGAAGAVDELGDEATGAAAEVGVLGTVMDKTAISAGALSINVGAFTIALRQLHTQIPLIVTTLGSLISVLGGVGSAALAAAGGISALFAGGAIGLIEQVEEQFSDVNSAAEAMEKIIRGIADMFREALDPLVNVENTELFISFLENLAKFTNRSAQAIQASRRELLQFFEVITSSGDFDEFAGSLQNLFDFTPGGEFETAGEVLARFIGFLVEELPDAIDFFNRVTVSMAAPLQEVMKEFKSLTIELVEFAEGAAPGFLGAISTILGVFTSLFDALNDLDGSLLSSTVKTIAFTAILFRLTKAFDAVALIGFKFADLLGTLTKDLSGFADLTARIATAGQGFLDEYAKGVLKFSRSIVSQIPILKGFQNNIDELYDGDDNLKDFDVRLGTVRKSVDKTITSVKDLGGRIKSFGGGTQLAKQLQDQPDLFVDVKGRAQTTEGFAPQPDILKPGSVGKAAGNIKSRVSDMAGSVRKSLSKLRDTGAIKSGLESMSKTALDAGKRMAHGLGNVALGGLTTFTGGMISLLHPGLLKSKGMTEIFSEGLGRMSKGLNQLGLGIIPRVVKAIATKIGALYSSVAAFASAELASIKFAFAQRGVVSGLKQTLRSLGAAVVGLGSYVVGALAGAAASLTLNAALGGLPLLIGAVVAGAALLVGAIGNADGIASSAKSSFEGLKNFAIALGDALLGLLVPAFNLIVDIVSAILSPIFAIVDGFMLVVDSISSAVSQGEEGAGIMETFGTVMDVLGGILSVLGPVFRVIGDVIYAGVIAPFKVAAAIIGTVISVIVELISILRRLAEESGLIDAITQLVKSVKNQITGFVEALISVINSAIDKANKIPGVNIGEVGGAGGASSKGSGLKITESDVRDNLAQDSEDAGSDQADTTSPEFNLETSVSNTANVDAESSEKEDRIATLVERALKDANTYRRNTTGR